MAEITVKVGSITNAQKAKRILLKNGYSVTIKRAEQIKKGDGCGYSVVFFGDKQNAVKLLKKAGIKIISVSTYDLS